jgi:hypothetical protein
MHMKKLITILVVVLAAVAASAIVVVWVNNPTSGNAHEVPEGCNTSVASFPVPRIDAPGIIPPVSDDSVLNYRARVTLPALSLPEDPIEVLCALTDVDVFIRLPGHKRFQHVCRFDTLSEGETLQCPQAVIYHVDPLDAEQGRLRAQVRIMANVHDGQFDCSIPEKKRNPLRVSDCIDATALMSLEIVEDPGE